MRYFLTVSFCFVICSTAFSQDKSYKIGFLLDKTNSKIASLVDKLEEEITAVVGEDATVVFPDNNRYTNNFDPLLAKKQ